MTHIVDERGYNQIFASNQAQIFRLERRADAIIAALPVISEGNLRVLELGCGTGELAALIARRTPAHVTGVDLSPQFIAAAQARHQRANLTFAVTDLTQQQPTSAEQGYHAIVGNGILHHLYHHFDTIFPALKAWLVAGGRLIFWEPNLLNPYVWAIFSVPRLRHLTKLEPTEMAFTPTFATKQLTRAGFVNVNVATRDFLLPNTPDSLIKPVATASDWLDRIPLLNRMAQSLFIVAERPDSGAESSDPRRSTIECP